MKAQPAGLQKRPNLLMTAGIGLTERDEKKELLYGLMGALLGLSSLPLHSRKAATQACALLSSH